MKNDFEIVKDKVLIRLERQDGDNQYAMIDLGDFDMASSIPGRWYAIWKKTTKSYYVYTHVGVRRKSITIYLHRLIMNPDELSVVDHINHDTLNNTRENLRIVSRFENSQNVRKQSDNTSGIRGVTWVKRDRKWRVKFKIRGEYLHFGSFHDFDHAKAMAESVMVVYAI